MEQDSKKYRNIQRPGMTLQEEVIWRAGVDAGLKSLATNLSTLALKSEITIRFDVVETCWYALHTQVEAMLDAIAKLRHRATQECRDYTMADREQLTYCYQQLFDFETARYALQVEMGEDWKP
jgi:hypothetical protein